MKDDYLNGVKTKLFDAVAIEDPMEQDTALTEVLVNLFQVALDRGIDHGYSKAYSDMLKDADSVKRELCGWLEQEFQQRKNFISVLRDNVTAVQAGNPEGIPLRPLQYYQAILMVREPELHSVIRIRDYVHKNLGITHGTNKAPYNNGSNASDSGDTEYTQ
jgi:hypothetical protein